MKDEPMKKMRIRKGDKVIAIAGNDKGQTGAVLRVVGEKAVVQGINVRKKHVKKSQASPQGGIISIEKPVHISNLSLCTDDNKPVKLRVRFDDKGNRELYYKIDGQDVLYRSVRTHKT